MSSKQGGESREILIKHLRAELEELKYSAKKFEELNHAMVTLENNYRILKEEKDKSEREAQLKALTIEEGIKEAETDLVELRDEFQEADRISNEAQTQLQNLRSQLEFLEQKEMITGNKLEEMNRVIEDSLIFKDRSEADLDILKKDISELRANVVAIEKDQSSLDERISKLRQAKSSQKGNLIDLETEEQRLLIQREEKLRERDRLSNNFTARETNVRNLSQNLSTLEERSDIVNNEIKKMNIAIKELEIRRLEEEAIGEEISQQINSKEAVLKQLEDQIQSADLSKEKLVNSVNDQKDNLEKNQRDSDKLSTSLKRLMETHTKVLFFFLSRKLTCLAQLQFRADEIRVSRACKIA